MMCIEAMFRIYSHSDPASFQEEMVASHQRHKLREKNEVHINLTTSGVPSSVR